MERLSDEEMAQMRSRFEASTDGVLGVAEGYLAAPKGRKIMVHDLRRERPGNGGYAVATFGPLSAPDSRPDAEMFAHARIDGLALLDNLVDARATVSRLERELATERAALTSLLADLRRSRLNAVDRSFHAVDCTVQWGAMGGAGPWFATTPCSCGFNADCLAAAERIDAALKDEPRK